MEARMTYDDDPDRFPYSAIWLKDQYENAVRASGTLIDLPNDAVRRTIEMLAIDHLNWGPARIRDELVRPRSRQQSLVPPGFEISELAVKTVVDQLRQHR
jgi:hypothetical protein